MPNPKVISLSRAAYPAYNWVMSKSVLLTSVMLAVFVSVPHRPRLFSRLWCIFELAAFRKANPKGKIVLAPLLPGERRSGERGVPRIEAIRRRLQTFWNPLFKKVGRLDYIGFTW